jgi:hypothetical protein
MRRVDDSERGEVGSYGWLLGTFCQLSKSTSSRHSHSGRCSLHISYADAARLSAMHAVPCLSVLVEGTSGPLERQT